MGAWGVMGLESDDGLDVVDFLQEHIPSDGKWSLAAVMQWLRDDGFLGDGIDFFFDNSAMALTELYLQFLDDGFIDYDHEQEERSLRKGITSFTADRASLEALLRQLRDIRDEVPDEDGEREIVELWRDSDSWEEWSAHLAELIRRLEQMLTTLV